MKIGLDFDGVIANNEKLKSVGAKRLYGVDIPPEKFSKEFALKEKLLTEGQYRDLRRAIYGTRKLGLLMEPVEGVLHYLPLLIAQEHTVRVITARYDNWLEIAKEWSLHQGLDLDFIGVGDGNSKANAAAGLDIFVDDTLDMLKLLVDVVPHRYLFSWGYNTHVDTGPFAQRVGSWKDLYRTVQTLQSVR